MHRARRFHARMIRRPSRRRQLGLGALAVLVASTTSGCYLFHLPEGDPPPDRPPTGVDAARPLPPDAGRRDAGPPRLVDAAAPDAGSRDSGPPLEGCELPAEPYPDDDVCAPETAACIEACGTADLCIVGCLQRDEPCRVCSVRNALSCFNETSCVRHYPAMSCCIVESCAADSIDDVLNVCTVVACEPELRTYADCAIAVARLECREAVARCGVPPNLLGLD